MRPGAAPRGPRGGAAAPGAPRRGDAPPGASAPPRRPGGVFTARKSQGAVLQGHESQKNLAAAKSALPLRPGGPSRPQAGSADALGRNPAGRAFVGRESGGAASPGAPPTQSTGSVALAIPSSRSFDVGILRARHTEAGRGLLPAQLRAIPRAKTSSSPARKAGSGSSGSRGPEAARGGPENRPGSMKGARGIFPEGAYRAAGRAATGEPQRRSSPSGSGEAAGQRPARPNTLGLARSSSATFPRSSALLGGLGKRASACEVPRSYAPGSLPSARKYVVVSSEGPGATQSSAARHSGPTAPRAKPRACHAMENVVDQGSVYAGQSAGKVEKPGPGSVSDDAGSPRNENHETYGRVDVLDACNGEPAGPSPSEVPGRGEGVPRALAADRDQVQSTRAVTPIATSHIPAPPALGPAASDALAAEPALPHPDARSDESDGMSPYVIPSDPEDAWPVLGLSLMSEVASVIPPRKGSPGCEKRASRVVQPLTSFRQVDLDLLLSED